MKFAKNIIVCRKKILKIAYKVFFFFLINEKEKLHISKQANKQNDEGKKKKKIPNAVLGKILALT